MRGGGGPKETGGSDRRKRGTAGQGEAVFIDSSVYPGLVDPATSKQIMTIRPVAEGNPEEEGEHP